MTNPYDPLLTLDEAGDLLGTGPDLPRRLVAHGHLDAVRESGRLRVPFSAVLAYLTTTTTERSSARDSAAAPDDAA